MTQTRHAKKRSDTTSQAATNAPTRAESALKPIDTACTAEPAMYIGTRFDAKGTREAVAVARGSLAIVAMASILIVLFIVAGVVLMARVSHTPVDDLNLRDRRGAATER
jgi:hypothetical protein